MSFFYVDVEGWVTRLLERASSQYSSVYSPNVKQGIGIPGYPEDLQGLPPLVGT